VPVGPSAAPRPRRRTIQANVSRLIVFAAISAALHGAAFVVLGRKPTASPTFEAGSQALVGDTLAMDPAAIDEPAEPESTPTPTSTPTSTPTPTLASRSLPSWARGAPGSSPARAASTSLFGAVGASFATDLATTFTRAFPQAASADPVWSSVSFGGAGRADVRLVLDDAGHLVDSQTTGSPSPALRRSIERTLALLAPRAFTASGAVTRLRITARVSRDDVHDGLHGDVFALSAGSFSGEVGTAFFALPASTGDTGAGERARSGATGGARDGARDGAGDGARDGARDGRRVDVEVRLLP
jgi:hypothetical protein